MFSDTVHVFVDQVLYRRYIHRIAMRSLGRGHDAAHLVATPASKFPPNGVGRLAQK